MKKQILRFGLVGVINTLVDVVSFVVMIYAGTPMIVAVLVSTSLGLVCSFSLNHVFVFEKNGSVNRTSIIRFLLVTCVGLWLIQPVIISGLAYLLGNSSEIALTIYKLLATAVTMVWNFTWYRSKVFSSR